MLIFASDSVVNPTHPGGSGIKIKVMKTRVITLISHYNKIELNLRINAYGASILESFDNPMDGINNDLDRFHYKIYLVYMSEGQARKISNFFAKDNMDYFDKVLFK